MDQHKSANSRRLDVKGYMPGEALLGDADTGGKVPKRKLAQQTGSSAQFVLPAHIENRMYWNCEFPAQLPEGKVGYKLPRLMCLVPSLLCIA